MRNVDSSASPRLSEVFRVRERYCRSINLQLDWASRTQLAGYLVSNTGRALAERIVGSAVSARQPRAWSITGPYGCGKSSFALFLADLVSTQTPTHPEGCRIRERTGVGKRRLYPLLLVGERASLASSLLAGLARALAPLSESLSQEALRASRQPHPEQKLRGILDRASTAAGKKGYDGLLFVVDEFGKYLEYAALHPDKSDFFLLQDLAEFADRKSGAPLVLLTILHTAFSEYVNRFETARRSEWQKVQGRFVDVVFQEPAEQFLQLIAAAVQRTESYPAIRVAESRALQILNSSAFEEARKRFPVQEILPRFLPLHPATGLMLWPVFRGKLAQNERSLFAFLGAHEPLGFQDFLDHEPFREPLPLYGLDKLYDYIVHTLRDAAFRGDRARRWAEIDNALNRLPGDAPEYCHAAIKTIGLLGLYGRAVGLRATTQTLVGCLGSEAAARAAVRFLEQKSIIIFRKHDQSYAIWEGSDLDLESVAERAMSAGHGGSLAARIREMIALPSIVARSHYIQTGTLRYFAVDVVDGTVPNVENALTRPIQSDGTITYVLSAGDADRNSLMEHARRLSRAGKGALRILAFPRPMVGLERSLREAEVWSWIQRNEPRLQHDPVARQEVRARLNLAVQELHGILGSTFNLSGHAFDPRLCDWIHEGHEQTERSGRQFLRWLSDMCRKAFPQSPTFKNELLNRRELSSAAAAARRNLLERLLSNPEIENLGIEGYPPEFSMYMSLLRDGGFHIQRHGAWQVAPPHGDWAPVWQAIEHFLASTSKERRPIRALFEMLQGPPFGIKEGSLPVILCCVLLAKKGSVALYESGVFVPELRIEVFERILRATDQFEIQEHNAGPSRRGLLDALGRLLNSLALADEGGQHPSIVQVVKPLVVAARKLPPYVRQTRRVQNSKALAVRDLLLAARDPFALVFEELPRALSVAATDTEAYVAGLSKAILVLQHVYAALLDELEVSIREAFVLSGNAASVRQQLRGRAAPLVGRTVDPTLTLLIRELSNIGERDWREVIARSLSRGLPPAQWQDTEVTSFQLRLAQFARDFVRLEELVLEQSKTGANEIIRVGILNGRYLETRGIIPVDAEKSREITAVATRLEELLASAVSGKRGDRIALAALSRVVHRLLAELDEVPAQVA